jgi:hypothetical protein
MRKKTARLPRHALTGEPDLMSLLGDPMMMTLWRADHIDPEHAKQLFANTAERLHHRDGAGLRLRQGQRSERSATAEDDQSYAFV